MDQHLASARSLIGSIEQRTVAQIKERHDAHIRAIDALHSDYYSESPSAKANVQNVSLMTAYIVAILTQLHKDRRIPHEPHFSITEKARNLLMMSGGSDSQTYLTYAEMAEIAVASCMFSAEERQRVPTAQLDAIRRTIEFAMEQFVVNAGYLESASFFTRA